MLIIHEWCPVYFWWDVTCGVSVYIMYSIALFLVFWTLELVSHTITCSDSALAINKLLLKHMKLKWLSIYIYISGTIDIIMYVLILTAKSAVTSPWSMRRWVKARVSSMEILTGLFLISCNTRQDFVDSCFYCIFILMLIDYFCR